MDIILQPRKLFLNVALHSQFDPPPLINTIRVKQRMDIRVISGISYYSSSKKEDNIRHNRQSEFLQSILHE